MQLFSSKYCILPVVCAMLCVACSDDDGTNQKVNLYVANDVEDDLPTYTGLPIVEIRTEDGQTLTDKETWKTASITFHGMGEYDDFTDEVLIKGRGNSTFKRPKLPFNLKFSSKRSWLGMKKSKHWAFLANYYDPTLIRNDLTFYLGKLTSHLEWTPSGEFVELVFNGYHVGNYYVTERIKVESNRLNIKEIKEEDADILTGGYLVEVDKWFDEINQFKTAINQWPICIKSPDEEWCTAEHVAYISTYINTLEKHLQEGRFDQVHELIDMPSFVDYYIIQAFCGNPDFDKERSVFCYKNRNGKLYAGPLWDFDYGTYVLTKEYLHRDCLWYKYLFNDPLFVTMLKERWAELEETLCQEALARIQQRERELAASAAANFLIFPPPSKSVSRNRNDRKWDEAVAAMKAYIPQRKAYLDTFINGL